MSELQLTTRELLELHLSYHREQHALEKAALDVAKEDVDRRLEEMNNFREQIDRERQGFVTREYLDTKLDEFNRRVSLLERQASNSQGRLWSLGIGWTVVVVAIEIALRFIKT